MASIDSDHISMSVFFVQLKALRDFTVCKLALCKTLIDISGLNLAKLACLLYHFRQRVLRINHKKSNVV